MSDSPLNELLEKNREWSERVQREDPGFFERLSLQQAPEYLWIGCSDSRVPANQIIDMAPETTDLFSVSPGQGGNPLDRHYDDLVESHLKLRYAPMPSDAETGPTQVLELVPAGQ